MSFPTNEELREWWKKEQEFMDTTIGRYWYQMRHEIQRLQREHAIYQSTVLEYAERHPNPPVIFDTVLPPER